MTDYEIICGCGRTMTQVHQPGRPRYVCGCGATIKAVYTRGPQHENFARGRCQMWIGGARCGQRVIPGRQGTAPAAGQLCPDCAKRLLDDSLTFDTTRDYLIDALGRQEIAQARQRIALDEFRQQRDEEQQRKQAAKQAQVHVVYYVRLGEDHIKIGTTGRLADRMAELRVANPDNLLAAEPGSYEVEKQRHRKFALLKYDRRREDFAESPRLLQHIAHIREQWGDPWDLEARLVAGRTGGELDSA